MFKKLIFIIPLTLAAGLAAPAHALDDIVTTAIDEPTTVSAPVAPLAETSSANDGPAASADQADSNADDATEPNADNANDAAPTIEISDPENIMSCSGMLDCIEENIDPETWPLILSASALILTILLIIIINLIANRKTKKIREEA